MIRVDYYSYLIASRLEKFARTAEKVEARAINVKLRREK